MSNFQSAGNAVSQVVDRWRWYFAALKDPKEIGKSLPVHENEPQQGYYRTRNQAGGLDPVAIFYPEGANELVAYRGGREVAPDHVWSFCCRMPVTYDAYQIATQRGVWSDDDETVAAQIAPAPPGHNSGDVSEVEILRDQIEAAKKGAGAYAKITDDAMLTKAQSLRSRLNELSGEADKKREALKRPHFEAGKAIDKEWQPLVKSAKEAADGIRAAMSAYETEKLRKLREEQRLADEARQRAEDEARKAAEAGQPVVPVEPIAAPVAVAPAPIKGTYGKAASVRAKMVATRITDAVALFGYFNGHPRIDDLLLKLAQDEIDAGRKVPGIETSEVAKVA